MTTLYTNVRFAMFNQNNYNNPYGGRNAGRSNAFSSRYQYQTLQYGATTQASGLIGKVMSLLAFSFIFAALGGFVGVYLNLGLGGYLIVVIAGFITLFALHVFIQRP